MSKVKKLISVILAMAICFGTIGSLSLAVNAASQAEIYMIDLPRSNDPNKSGWGRPDIELMNGWQMNASSKYDLKALGSFEGNIAYCIEPGIGLYTGDVLGQKGEDFWGNYPSQYNNTIGPELIKQYIGRVMHYGYVGKVSPTWTSTNSGADAIAESIATQMIIWEVIVGERDEDFRKIDATQYGKHNVMEAISSSHPLRSKIYQHYNRIASSVRNHTRLPSGFQRSASSAQTYELEYNGSEYAVTIPDSTGMLSQYNFSANTSGVTFTISGNNLVIKVKNPATQTIQVTADRKNSQRRGIITWTDGIIGQDNNGQMQDVVSYGETVNDPVKGYLNLKINHGSVKIVKTSEDGKVSGVPFHIQGNGIDQDVTTGSNGEIQIDDIRPGVYTITERAIDKYEPQESKRVTVIGGKVATVTFNNTLKRGDLKVTKTSEDGLVEGVKFHLSGTSLSGLSVDEYAVTDSTGVAIFENVLISGDTPYVLEEVDTGDRYVVPEDQSAVIEWNKVTHQSFHNVLKKWRVTVTKSDAENGEPQGDASLANAKYGIYKGGQLIDTYYTDANGQFTTDWYVCGDDWTLQEIEPSDGYLIDPAVHHIGAEAGEYTIEYNEIGMDVTEQILKGQIALIKHTDDGETGIETPEEGAEFQVYLKSAGSYDQADPDERDLLVCDENGFAQTKPLPYGQYTVTQTKGWEGTELLPDFDVWIDEDGEIYRYLINNAVFESLVEIVKKDAETGKIIPVSGVGFKVKDLSTGEFITQHINYPTPADLDTFYTDSTGKLMLPEPLKYGKYELHEVQSCDGYVLNKIPIPFSVDGTQELITLEMSNTPQKGKIIIEKTGESFASVTESNGVYQPVYAAGGMTGAEYQVIADEDIYTLEGTLRYHKGDVVDTLVTGQDGKAESKVLYLGRFKVVETKAPDGMVLNPEPQYVTLTYAGQEVELTEAGVSFCNDRQKIRIDLTKIMEQDQDFGLGMNGELSRVSFALYAAETIKAPDGTEIPKDGLMEIIPLNEDGTATFKTDLPVGASVYVREYSTDGHYVISDKKYPVTFNYQGQEISTVHIQLNDGKPIENYLIRGEILGQKVDEDGFAVGGALFGLFSPEETEFTDQTAIMTAESNEIGVFCFDNVPFGDWLVRELKPAPAFVLNTTVYPVTVSEDAEVIEIEVENRFLTGSVQTTKVDAEYPDHLLIGAVFEVYVDVDGNQEFDAKVDRLAGQLEETEPGIYRLDGLRYNGYFLHEKKAPDRFHRDDGYYYFEVRTDGEVVIVENEVGVGFVNQPIKGILEITKTDESGEIYLPDTGFAIYDESGGKVAEGFTDENGKLTFELRAGKYICIEFAAKSGYLKQDIKYPFEITEDGQIISLTVTNEKIEADIPQTGDDSHFGLCLWLAGLAGCGVVFTVLYKRKRSK